MGRTALHSLWGSLILLLSACGGEATDDGPLGMAGETSSGGLGGLGAGAAGGSSAVRTGGTGGLNSGTATGATGTGASSTLGSGGVVSGSGAAGSAGGPTGAGGFSEFCLGNSYDANPDEAVLDCEPWSICQPGTFQDDLGTTRTDTVCTTCPERTFSAAPGAFSCLPWQPCAFGMSQAVEPSPIRDRSCQPSLTFPLPIDQVYYPEDLVGLAATSSLIYLALSQHVVRYSSNGALLDPWSSPDYIELGDITKLGDDVFISGSRWTNQANLMVVDGILSKLAPNGETAWLSPFGASNERTLDVHVVGLGENLYVVGRLYEENCRLVYAENSSYFTTECDPPGPAQLFLRIFDSGGNATFNQLIETEAEVGDVYDVMTSSDGHIYVVADRVDRVFPDRCDEIDPIAEAYYYQYYCQLGLPAYHRVVFELTSTGTVVHEHGASTLLGRALPTLARDDDGYVYAISTEWSEDGQKPLRSYLVRFETAEGPVSVELDLAPGSTLTALESRADGFLVGGVTEAGTPLFLELSQSGAILSSRAFPDRTGSIDFIDAAPSGSIYFAGQAAAVPYVMPWPQ